MLSRSVSSSTIQFKLCLNTVFPKSKMRHAYQTNDAVRLFSRDEIDERGAKAVQMPKFCPSFKRLPAASNRVVLSILCDAANQSDFGKAPLLLFRPFPYLKIQLPRIRHLTRGNKVVDTRSFWFPAQFHSNFMIKSIPFTLVTLGARTRRIAPRVFSTATAWENVIECELVTSYHFAFAYVAKLNPAVDARPVVACKDIASAPA